MNSPTQSQLHPLEFSLYQKLKGQVPEKLLIAVSGGADSMALLEILRVLQGRLSYSLRVAHIHHGIGPDQTQNAYRDRAGQLVSQYCQDHDLEFLVNPPEDRAEFSEEALREYRYGFFKTWLEPNETLVTAHHSADLLETRLMNLIRGAGERGLASFKEESQGITLSLRPLISFSPQDLMEYLKGKEVSYFHDPSNQDHTYLRNWLRQVWLPQLEERRAGAVQNLSSSLQRLAESLTTSSEKLYSRLATIETGDGKSCGLRWVDLMTCTSQEQSQLIAEMFRRVGCYQFSKSHVSEVLKRLDSEQKSHRFKVKSCEWVVSGEQIEVCLFDKKG